jgi:hypothetical protein
MRVCILFGVLMLTSVAPPAGGATGARTDSIPPGKAYLGQRPPGRVPEVFAPGIISDAGYRLHGAVVFRPDRREVCWSVLPPAIMSKSLLNGIWSEARPVAVGGRGVQAPAFSADGRRMYYQAVVEGGRGSVDIWWVERTADGWGTPVNAGPAVNTDMAESQPCVTAEGTIYYTGTLEDVGFNRGIYRSRLLDGEYGPPELLGGGANSESIDYCPWIATDESFLLFASSRPRRDEPLFLHVCFRHPDGSWSEPESIHPALGFEDPARFPSVSPDGRYLFFISGDTAYWVDIAPVVELKSRGES